MAAPGLCRHGAPAVAEAALEEPAAEALELRPGQQAAVGAAEQFIARMAKLS